MKKFGFLNITIFVTLLIGVVGCTRDDDEPVQPTRPISRLYISTEDFQTITTRPVYSNIFIIDPADGNVFETTSINHNSGAIGGSALLFSPELERLLHASRNMANLPDTSVYLMSINALTGQLSKGNSITKDWYTSVRGLAYHADTDRLFLMNTGAQAKLFVVERARNKVNPDYPEYTIELNGLQPTSIFIHDLSLEENNRSNITYMTDGDNGTIAGYRDLPTRLQNDTVVTVDPDFTLTIPGAANLSGMSYSPALDMLVVSDFDDAEGRILFFDEFLTKTTTGTLTPSRIIEGSSTQLVMPVDIEIDGRENAKYIYVVERTGKSILRFNITDEGNVAPNGSMQVKTGTFVHTPVSISLDARGTLEAEGEE